MIPSRHGWGRMAKMIELATPSGFRLEATVHSHGWYRLAPYAWEPDSQTLTRAEQVESGVVVFLRISQQEQVLRIEWSPVRGARVPEITRRVMRMLQLQLDLTAFHRRCQRLRSHRDAGPAAFGRLLCGTTRFEDAVRVITTTNTAWRQTVRMNELLVGNYGSRDAKGRAAFPSPQTLAGVDPAELQERCRLGYRAGTIAALARGVAGGNVALEADFSGISTHDLETFFRTLPGIGPYGAAHMLALEGRHDRIAVDTEFRRYVRTHHFGGEDVSDRELCAVYEKWGRWKYLAYWWELWSEVEEQVATAP